MMPDAPAKLPLALRLILAPVRVLIAVVVLLDELARPVYRPVVRRFAALAMVLRAEKIVAALPPYGVLGLLAIPLVIVEPLKVIGVVWMGSGRFWSGLLLLAFAYAASFLVIERIYEAGHAKLMMIGWFRVAMGYVVRVRGTVLAWVRATELYRVARVLGADMREAARRAASGLRRHLGRLAGRA